MRLSLRQLEATIRKATVEQQRLFLAHLPQPLDLLASVLAFLKAAEESFGFWDNSDDAVDDRLQERSPPWQNFINFRDSATFYKLPSPPP